MKPYEPQMGQLTLLGACRDTYKFCFYCSATHVTSQVLPAKPVNKWYRGEPRGYQCQLQENFEPILPFREVKILPETHCCLKGH